MTNKYPKGSEWRKWDLHLHTASSFDYEYKGTDADELLCKSLKENNIEAVAITDHFKIDSSRIENLRTLAPDITFFPGVELRTDKGSANGNLHVILLFSELSDIKTLEDDFNAIMLRQKAKDKDDDAKIHWVFDEIVAFAEEQDALISVHAGKKENGLEKEITNALPVNRAIKEDMANSIDFFEVTSHKDIKDYRSIVFKKIDEKPLIICSDNHNPKDYTSNESLWIKADLTFEGLKQCVYQPQERVFVGTIPPKLDMSEKNKQNYIKSMSVKKIDMPKNTHDNWFDFDIPFNCGLTAIIGNKGSGKSAFSDIIGHLCNCKSMEYASFLHEDRFRRAPKKYAEDYLGNLVWLDDKKEENIKLSRINDRSSIEYAQYLPQKYIEKVCNDLEDEFQKEINEVIFSYIDSTEKGDSINLVDLIESKSIPIQNEINNIHNDLNTINKDIIKMEGNLTNEYIKELKQNLQKRNEDLQRHEKLQPTKKEKPENNQGDKYESKLKEHNAAIEKLEQDIIKKQQELTATNIQINKIDIAISEIEDLFDDVKKVNSSLENLYKSIDFDCPDLIMKLTTPIKIIKSKHDELIQKRQTLHSILDKSENADMDISLFAKQKQIVDLKKLLIDSADAKEKEYQKYLSDMNEWNQKKKNILGSVQLEGSVEYIKHEISYIENVLPDEYKGKKDERMEKITEIFAQKNKLVEIYKSLYAPVENALGRVLEEFEDEISFDTDIVLQDRNIDEELLSKINKSMKGIFNGRTQAQNKMTSLIKKTNYNDCDSVCNFVMEVLKCIDEDLDASIAKVPDKEEFYELLTQMDYIGVEFNLKLEGRDLLELSPGERGMVLLIFYLALNKNDIPLIIDQPEDNLDSQSVFAKLVPCILKAKRKRQVFIVTHNPNIAIACDAEQIIYCSIDKSSNQISYISGSIENNTIKRKVIDVLEGTKPAFNLRKLKYNDILTS